MGTWRTVMTRCSICLQPEKVVVDHFAEGGYNGEQDLLNICRKRWGGRSPEQLDKWKGSHMKEEIFL